MERPRSSQQDRNKQWKLEKYARFLGETRGKGKRTETQNAAKWKLFEGSKDSLTLTITASHHLLITYGTEIQENHSMWNAQQWMKGITKEDSILIIYKIQDETRQFRIKFASSPGYSGLDYCKDAISSLSMYFMIKELNTKPNQKGSSQEGGSQPCTQSDQLSVGKLAQVLTGQLEKTLPKAYQTTHLPTDPASLDTLVRLCVTDTNFPGFVGAVDAALGKVIKENE